MTEVRIPTGWPDFDALGHLNHAVYHLYLDEARDDVCRSGPRTRCTARPIGDADRSALTALT